MKNFSLIHTAWFLLLVPLCDTSCSSHPKGKTVAGHPDLTSSPSPSPVSTLETIAPTQTSTPLIAAFAAKLGDPSPEAKKLTLAPATTSSPLSWVIEESVPWLDVAPRKGTGEAVITVTPHLAGLDTGQFKGTFTASISDGKGIAKKVMVNVTLDLSNDGVSNVGLTESNVNSNLSEWHASDIDPALLPKLDESTVFHSLLRHSGKGQDWTIKIGKGGQIYSIKTPLLGELIPKQRVKAGQWVDEVLQHTFPMPPRKDPGSELEMVDGDIHQAGFYVQSDLTSYQGTLPDHSVYSPLFSYQYYPRLSKVQYMTWPQHAHLPRFGTDTAGFNYEARNYRQNLVFMRQTLTDMDDGVMQIEVEFMKWGGDVHTKTQMPWAVFRTAAVPEQLISTPTAEGEGYIVNSRVFGDKTVTPLKLGGDEIGSWIALSKENSSDGKAIGIVFGRPQGVTPGIVRWGTYKGTMDSKDETMGGTVVSVLRNIDLAPGDTLLSRYFVVLGNVAHIREKARMLESKVVFEKKQRPLSEAGTTLVCRNAQGILVSRCKPEDTAVFKAFREFVPGAQPLFLLRNRQTGVYRLTHDPYAVSFNPTDGRTEYIDILGWALPPASANDQCLHSSIGEILSSTAQPPVFEDVGDLRVVRLEWGCPP
jgi:hypothetical protein